MTILEIVLLSLLILPYAGVGLVLVLNQRRKDELVWTRCWNCGIFFGADGQRVKLPMDGRLRNETGCCWECMNNHDGVRPGIPPELYERKN